VLFFTLSTREFEIFESIFSSLFISYRFFEIIGLGSYRMSDQAN